MTKFKIISLGGLALAATVASLMVQHQSQDKLRAGDVLLRQQDQQLAVLTAEQQRLSNLVARAQNRPPADYTAELAKLRADAEALKKQTNDLVSHSQKSTASSPSQLASTPEHHTPEYYEQLHQMAGRKQTDALYLATALFMYASAHENQCPSNLDQAGPYLTKRGTALSGSNQFEMVYQGSFDRLKGLPWGTVALIRESQPWAGPDGRMFRLYGMIDGSSQMIGSDDNFQAWEAKHVISLPKDGQAER